MAGQYPSAAELPAVDGHFGGVEGLNSARGESLAATGRVVNRQRRRIVYQKHARRFARAAEDGTGVDDELRAVLDGESIVLERGIVDRVGETVIEDHFGGLGDVGAEEQRQRAPGGEPAGGPPEVEDITVQFHVRYRWMKGVWLSVRSCRIPGLHHPVRRARPKPAKESEG